MVILRETLETQSRSHKKIIPFSLFCQGLYCSLQPWKLFAGGFSPLQQNLGIESEVFWWNVSVSDSFGLTVFMHLLFSLNVWFLRLTSMNVQNEFQRCICMSPWERKADLKQQSCCWGIVCFIQFGHGSSAMWIIWIVTATVVVTTGTNFSATDLVMVRIPCDCEKILNYSSWKKYILFVQTGNRKES